jgi:hypothetical protein
MPGALVLALGALVSTVGLVGMALNQQDPSMSSQAYGMRRWVDLAGSNP